MSIKEKIKKNKFILNIYIKYDKIYIKFLNKFFPVHASKKMYKAIKGKKINLKNPITFNEKLMYIKLKNYNYNKNVFQCSDKYLVREYAMSKGVSENNLPKLLKVYKNTKEINFDELPNKFVLKCSHGCGFNIVCKDKNKLDKNEAINKLQKWKKTKFGFDTAETHYSHVKPTIFCEEYIENKNGGFPNDYKIYCFHGEPKLILICSNREKKVNLNYYDLSWKELKFIGKSELRNKNPITKPECLEEMLKIAKKLSQEFPYVRIDFYEHNNKAVLGEMTFTPAGCCAQYYTEEGEIYLGKLLDINK